MGIARDSFFQRGRAVTEEGDGEVVFAGREVGLQHRDRVGLVRRGGEADESIGRVDEWTAGAGAFAGQDASALLVEDVERDIPVLAAVGVAVIAVAEVAVEEDPDFASARGLNNELVVVVKDIGCGPFLGKSPREMAVMAMAEEARVPIDIKVFKMLEHAVEIHPEGTWYHVVAVVFRGRFRVGLTIRIGASSRCAFPDVAIHPWILY